MYRTDLAYIHEEGFSWYARRSAPAILRLLKANGVREGVVVDLGCGNGILEQTLVGRGYQAVGLDASPSMIRLARKNCPEGTFFVADLKDAKLPACDAVTSIGEVLSFAFHDGLKPLFRRVYKALRKGGVFLLDCGTEGNDPGGMPRGGHWHGDDWTVIVDAEYDSASSILTRRIMTFREVGDSYRKKIETHRLRLYRAGDVMADLTSCGFHVKRLRGFGQVRFRSGHAGFLARKPG